VARGSDRGRAGDAGEPYGAAVGRLYRDLLQLLVQAVILIALGYALGMDASLGGLLLGVLLTLLIGGACAAASNALALTTKSEDVMAPVINVVMMPVLLLSGILLPMTIGPAWLVRASDFMPIRHVVDAVRQSFAGDLASSSMFWGSLWSVVLFVLALWWGTATFRRENA
jgi:ABC-2 type transport system permease protein